MKPSGPVLRKSEYEVVVAPYGAVRELVAAYHYARGSGQALVFRHGLYRRDDPVTLRGAALWMASAPGVARSVGSEPSRSVTLSRLVVVPGEPTNSATFLMSASIRMVRADGRYDTAVTFADEGQGHTGAIYRATNWHYLGTTVGAAGGGWVDSEGRRVDRRLGPWYRTEAEMVALGYARLPASRKHKFVIRF